MINDCHIYYTYHATNYLFNINFSSSSRGNRARFHCHTSQSFLNFFGYKCSGSSAIFVCHIGNVQNACTGYLVAKQIAQWSQRTPKEFLPRIHEANSKSFWLKPFLGWFLKAKSFSPIGPTVLRVLGHKQLIGQIVQIIV